MKKAELVTKVAQEAAMTKRQASAVVDAFMAEIQAALSRGERVTLVEFGTFAVRPRASRRGRNPRTGQEVIISARRVPTFRAGKRLRDAIRHGT